MNQIEFKTLPVSAYDREVRETSKAPEYREIIGWLNDKLERDPDYIVAALAAAEKFMPLLTEEGMRAGKYVEKIEYGGKTYRFVVVVSASTVEDEGKMESHVPGVVDLHFAAKPLRAF